MNLVFELIKNKTGVPVDDAMKAYEQLAAFDAIRSTFEYHANIYQHYIITRNKLESEGVKFYRVKALNDTSIELNVDVSTVARIKKKFEG
jgi:hypothetical protein